MEVLSKIISFIMVVVFLCLHPLGYQLGHRDSVASAYAENETTRFVDTIRSQGYLDVGMYEEFLNRLSVTGELYDIEIEHAVPKEGEWLSALKDLPGILVASADLQSLPAEIHDGIVTSFATHTHTVACYDGVLHVCDGVHCDLGLTAVATAPGGLYYTTNGLNWTKAITCSPREVAYGNGLFVAVGTNATWTSSDGIAWTKNNVLLNFKWIKYGSGAFVAVTTDQWGNYVYQSKDGVSWNKLGGLTVSIDSFAYTKGYFYFGYNNGYCTVYKYGDIFVFNNSAYVETTYTQAADYATCYHRGMSSENMLFYSGNSSVLWSRERSGTYYNYQCYMKGNGEYIFFAPAQYAYRGTYRSSTLPSFGAKISDFTLSNNELGIYFGNKYLITGYNYGGSAEPVAAVSVDGINWTTASIPERLTGLACNIEGGTGVMPGTCTNVGKYLDASGTEVQPICDKVVTSIAATHPEQAVREGEHIITTAIATYLDGHTGIVNCTSDFNPNVITRQTVTLTYFGLVGNAKTTGTRTCTIEVNVGSMPEALEVRASAYLVYHGSEPTYTVTVKYAGGSTKVITTGYRKTGCTPGPGTKTVTFSYTENDITVSASVTIIVKPNLSGITVMPSSQSVERYTDPVFTVRADYEDGSFRDVIGASISGFDNSLIGLQEVTVSYTENGITCTTVTQITVTPMIRVCSVCGNTYFLNEEDFDAGCPSCKTIVSYIQISPEFITVNRYEPLNIKVTATFQDGHTETVMGWSSNYDPTRTGMQLVMVSFRGKYAFISVMVVSVSTCSICGADYSLNEDGSDPGCPYCKEALVSISASPSYQAVNQGEDISLTVMGIYRDGHKEVVQGWHCSYDKNIPGEQLVTVYYGDLSCTVTVEVISEFHITCSVCGEVYNLREYPWGCPVCSDTIIEIDASLQSGGTLVPYGEKLDLRVILTYRDGQKAIAFEGWSDTFDPYTMGTQTVTVSISDRFGNTVSCVLDVEVTDRLIKMVCENGHVYYTEDPLTGCPYCTAGSERMTDNYYSVTYVDDILDNLYTNGIYRFKSGDYVTVKVTRRIQGNGFTINIFHGKKEDAPVTYGGEVA